MAASGGTQRMGYGAVKQVTKSNYSSALQQFKSHIRESDFIAVSSQKTGDFSQRHPWRRILPIDTPETAYLKAKVAAETFELLQFAVCPFRIQGSKVQAYPYNFHLFPRDELNLGMPSYSFSCQTSFLTSMVREGFDFNVCIYDGISYLSRVQESKAKERNPIPQVHPQVHPIASSQSPSVADSLFMTRIKSRVENWRNACKDKANATDGCLVKSLRKLILGNELYGSRPCTSIDVCSERQIQLVLEVVSEIGNDLVPLVVPEGAGRTKVVRVVLTTSEEDKYLLMDEIHNLEEEQNLKVRGFREVIDLISSSHKPVIAYNCLHDFTFIHSKFLAPLPPRLTEFMCSLRLVFPNVLDVEHLSKEVGPLKKAKNLSAAHSYLKRQFFVPIKIEVPQRVDDGDNDKNHGHNVLRITSLFVKLSNLLKITPDCQSAQGKKNESLEDYSNFFFPTCNGLREPGEEDAGLLVDKFRRKVSTDRIVFLWGFGSGMSTAELKRRLEGIHPAPSEDFDLQLVDKTCAVLVFSDAGSAKLLLKDMQSEEIVSGSLKEMVAEGLKGAGYEAYNRVCKSGLWEADLGDLLETASSETECEDDLSAAGEDAAEIYWSNEWMIDLNDL